MMKRSALLAAMAVSLLATAPAEAAKSAYKTGIASAKKRGFSNAECYASVFATYAAQNRNGKFRAPAGAGRAAIGYRNEQMSKCGISI
ncbi:hypothetical protein ASE66_10920 [Bosea sp. Root483D1]|nr:hypothetical protein ASE66_10920 [Bosea sp. Root483D1]